MQLLLGRCFMPESFDYKKGQVTDGVQLNSSQARDEVGKLDKL